MWYLGPSKGLWNVFYSYGEFPSIKNMRHNYKIINDFYEENKSKTKHEINVMLENELLNKLTM